MLSLRNVSLSLGGRSILDDVSFDLGRGEKVGLVGVNGAGKSSLLKIITGQSRPDDGQVIAPEGIGYLAQDPRSAYPPEQTLVECFLDARGLLSVGRELERAAPALGRASAGGREAAMLLERYGVLQRRWEEGGGYEAESDAQRLLAGLGLGRVDLEQPYATLSGGQKTRLALGVLLFSRPKLLVLDEPTNHLDRDSAAWLMGYLATFAGSLLLVSHDLALLDRAITRILRIDERTGQVDSYRGNYSAYLAQAASLRAQSEKRALLVGRQIAKLEATADRWRVGPRAAQARALESRAERLRRTMPTPPPASSRTPRFRLADTPKSGRVVLEVRDIEKSYGRKRVLKDLRFAVERGERLALLGPNGAGKTTLLKLLAGRLRPDLGTFALGQNVRIGYYAQEHEGLDPTATVLEEARHSAAVSPDLTTTDGQLRSFLGAFLFSGAKVFQRVDTLSGGERTRLALAKLFIERTNLLLLDEPTNNLDVASQEALLEVLRDFGGAVIIVCHHLPFLQRLGPTRALRLPEGTSANYDAAPVVAEASYGRATVGLRR